jgi:hypothetical protein
MVWQPTEFRRFEASFPTSTSPARIVTDAGKAYLKGLGNPEGPHVLASEWLAANLAKWFGLRTFDFSIMQVREGDEIELRDGAMVLPGSAFVTRAERGNSWGGSAEELQHLINPQDISSLIVFDTWIRNRDRYVPGGRRHYDNLFLSSERTHGEARELVAMDHTHAFSNNTELTGKLHQMTFTQDGTIYGAFPEFHAFWNEERTAEVLHLLGTCDELHVTPFIDQIPNEWQVDGTARSALKNFVVDRARWLASQPPMTFRPQV